MHDDQGQKPKSLFVLYCCSPCRSISRPSLSERSWCLRVSVMACHVCCMPCRRSCVNLDLISSIILNFRFIDNSLHPVCYHAWGAVWIFPFLYRIDGGSFQ